ncbi:CPBP family intramembrane glutamic endopeptidase [Maledivibacter halophilus]|uniref:CAAX prenyl protease 2/Lysostaphin resistance protein A-like domain-containing protein n=1 Tax=Maledivibacter halophilus TaxID=36842 RepID=A0A1T5KZP9_9FIRM|nr:type II CAAX endopeptidase family protein [Maledivibacter halophilus]SKC69191.1 hypothetical protein SAMN02194393_02220 [Maledivibacter halophilus]
MKKELRFFYIFLIAICTISYSISILVTQLGILVFGTPIFMLIYGVAGYSPAIAAYFTIKRYGGQKNELKLFMRSIINMKQSVPMYVYTICTPIILWITAYIVYRTIGGEGDLLLFRKPIYSLIWLVPVMIIGGGIEEIGWRGYLLPKLLEKFSPTLSTLLIGGVWAIWHLPMWLVVGAPQQNFEFITFAISCMATSFIMTPLYCKTRSIWLCILLHSMVNACFYVFTVAIDSNYLTSITTLFMAIVLFYISMNIFEIKKRNIMVEEN